MRKVKWRYLDGTTLTGKPLTRLYSLRSERDGSKYSCNNVCYFKYKTNAKPTKSANHTTGSTTRPCKDCSTPIEKSIWSRRQRKTVDRNFRSACWNNQTRKKLQQHTWVSAVEEKDSESSAITIREYIWGVLVQYARTHTKKGNSLERAQKVSQKNSMKVSKRGIP